MGVLDMSAEREKPNGTVAWGVKGFYGALRHAINSKAALLDKMLALFEFFLPNLYMHDNNRNQYYSVLAATPLPGMLFEAKYEEIGELPSGPPAKTPECGVSMKCFEEMKKVCNWGGGLECNVCLDVWYPKLMLLNHCPLISTLLQAQTCFCGEAATLI